MKQVGLALGSGGPRGLAHIGVMKFLLESGYEITQIAGTSVGAMMGGFYAFFTEISKVEQIFSNLTLTELATMFGDVGTKSGIIKGEGLEKFLASYLGEVKIEDLALPYSALTTNFKTGESVAIRTGSLVKAIRLSGSLPGIFKLANIEDDYFIDGGASEPVPVETVKKMGSKYSVAVNLDEYGYKKLSNKRAPSAASIGVAAMRILRHNLAIHTSRSADLVITPDVAKYSWVDLANKQKRIEIIQAGYVAAKSSFV